MNVPCSPKQNHTIVQRWRPASTAHLVASRVCAILDMKELAPGSHARVLLIYVFEEQLGITISIPFHLCMTDINECANGTLHTCDVSNHQQCINTLGSYHCDCELGFEESDLDEICQGCLKQLPIASYGHTSILTISDVNECSSEVLNNCTHLCNNTEGSYLCFCEAGFVLHPADNSTCIGKSQK